MSNYFKSDIYNVVTSGKEKKEKKEKIFQKYGFPNTLWAV